MDQVLTLTHDTNSDEDAMPERPERPERVVLRHRAFAAAGDFSFRAAETDEMPVMVMRLGKHQAVIPLRSLRSTLAIADESDDGEMLGLIADGLNFVDDLRPGDQLPAEVRSGEASWQFDPLHRKVAQIRLHMQLLHWLQGASGTAQRPDQGSGQRLANDAATRREVERAFSRAAQTLGLTHARQVILMVEDLAGELAYIEALRDRLLRRIHGVSIQIQEMIRTWKGDTAHGAVLDQVQRLMFNAMREIGERFAEVDAQTATLMDSLRRMESQRLLIRTSRDRLYRMQRRWQPFLIAWEQCSGGADHQTRHLLTRTYQFLIPHFADKTQWVSDTSLVRSQPASLDQPIAW